MADLSKPARSLDDVAEFGSLEKRLLKRPKAFIVEILRPMPFKSWELHEDGSHSTNYT